jgi:NADPH:quinone reductase-like Zn-dependent oxidoreductase
MKAITYSRYGGPEALEFEDVDQPVPGDGEVLVRVRAAAANPRDWHLLRGLPYLMRAQFGPRVRTARVLGGDVAGHVEAVGKAVTRFRPGDEVYGDTWTGGFAEYVSAPEGILAPKPANLSFEQAAAVPLAALTALQGLRDVGRVRPGQAVLIVGAAGGVGTFAVQLAKWLGAEVTGVCGTRNVDLVRSIGADHVVDYTREDIFRGGRTYDLVFQLAGTDSPAALRRLATPKGTVIGCSGDSGGRWIGPMDRLLKAVLLAPFVPQRLPLFMTKNRAEDLEVLTGLIEAGTVAPVIDRAYPLGEAAEAIRHLETGHARGKVVLTV